MKYNLFKIFKNIYPILIKLTLLTLGAYMFYGFLWLRFIRERLPKILPLKPGFFGLCLLIYICCIFAFIVYTLVKENLEGSPLIRKLVDYIYLPVITLDKEIKNLPFIYPFYKRFILWLPYYLEYLVIKTQILYYILVIMPRVILVTTLTIDTFYFHYLSNIYKILLIGLLLLFHRYFKYSLKYAKEYFLQELHFVTIYLEYEHARHIWPCVWYNVIDEETGGYLSGVDEDHVLEYGDWANIHLDDFIEYFINLRFEKGNFFEIIERCEGRVFEGTCRFDLNTHISDLEKSCRYRTYKYGPDWEWDVPCKYTKKEAEKMVRDLIQLATVLKFYQETHENNLLIKRMKIGIFSMYLICWLNILITSIPNLRNFPNWLMVLQDHIEPFSHLSLF